MIPIEIREQIKTAIHKENPSAVILEFSIRDKLAHHTESQFCVHPPVATAILGLLDELSINYIPSAEPDEQCPNEHTFIWG